LGVRANEIANAATALRRVLAQGSWPELNQMAIRARTYRPAERFLAVVRSMI
jgi:hypothetical protein